jgi:catechol 2,3-dioxygenase-like lactoylglutathione lyase family enzyme
MQMATLGYVCLGTNDFPRALAFYDVFFAAMGGRRWMTMPAGELYALETGPAVGIVRPNDGQAARPGNGTMLAFRVTDRADVARLYDLALSLGATSEGAPGPRDRWGDFAYIRDLDGNKLALYYRDRKPA